MALGLRHRSLMESKLWFGGPGPCVVGTSFPVTFQDCFRRGFGILDCSFPATSHKFRRVIAESGSHSSHEGIDNQASQREGATTDIRANSYLYHPGPF